jgi:hypothetical protein
MKQTWIYALWVIQTWEWKELRDTRTRWLAL